MKYLSIVVLLCLSSVYSANLPTSKGPKPFSNLKRYTVSGILSLPYAEINEPFEAWFDINQYASRIDFYNGMINTIQLAPSSKADYGVGIKVAPMTDEQVTNARTCFWVNGTSQAPLEIQSVIPSLDDFSVSFFCVFIFVLIWL
jgi:hypothetical protein